MKVHKPSEKKVWPETCFPETLNYLFQPKQWPFPKPDKVVCVSKPNQTSTIGLSHHKTDLSTVICNIFEGNQKKMILSYL